MTGLAGNRRRGRLRAAAVALPLALGAFAEPVLAGSAYGCRDLARSETLPVLEGAEGVFFRIDPDLHMHVGPQDETVVQLAALAETLKRNGTRLTFVPLAGKALSMPDHLPLAAEALGFDAGIAAAVWEARLLALTRAGVDAPDTRAALRAVSASGERPYFAADPRLSGAGAEALAGLLASRIAPGASAGAEQRVARLAKSDEREDRTLPSLMRLQVQQHCIEPLPDVTVTRGSEDAARAWTGAGAGRAPVDVMLVGSPIALDPALGLADALARRTGLEVAFHGLGGDAFAAVTDYLSSADFAARRPRQLVWVWPAWQPLGYRGDQPFRALRAAASGACDGVPVGARGAPKRLVADLDEAASGQVLALDPDTAAVGRAGFSLLLEDGRRITRWATRPEGGQGGRLFVPLSGLDDARVTAVDIALDAPPGAEPRLALCREG